MLPASTPVLSLDEAVAVEQRLFAGDEAKEWGAIRQAARAVADQTASDLREVLGARSPRRLLVLVGRGHNGADAIGAAVALAQRWPSAELHFWRPLGPAQRPLPQRAWREAEPALRGRAVEISYPNGHYEVILDGLFGFSYRPPWPEAARRACAAVNALSAEVRVAIDLPSGWAEPEGFEADFTYATGSVKAPAVAPEFSARVGRLRWLDLGFPREGRGPDRVLSAEVLRPLSALRPTACDKRSFGHLLVLAGHRRYPGAALLAVQAALRSGVGLVTAFVPEELVPSFAAVAPEAMWVGWPTTPEGGLALEGRYLAQAQGARGTAWVLGPGLGREPEPQVLLRELLKGETRPVVLDADALQPEVLEAAQGPAVLTPHAGEWARIARGRPWPEVAAGRPWVAVAKGAPTWLLSGAERYLVPVGGPVLARGGSGDLLAGLIGGRVAVPGRDLLEATAQATFWQGRAADWLARQQGAEAVRTTDLLGALAPSLRE